MNLKDIETNLPRGFQNAILRSISIRYDKQQVELSLSVLGEDDDESRRITVGILVEGLFYIVIEPPHPNYFDDAIEDGLDKLWVSTSTAHQSSGCESVTARLASLPLPPTAFRFRFLVHNWNAYIHIAATSARILEK